MGVCPVIAHACLVDVGWPFGGHYLTLLSLVVMLLQILVDALGNEAAVSRLSDASPAARAQRKRLFMLFRCNVLALLVCASFHHVIVGPTDR